MRISGHPILDDIPDRKKVHITVDGKRIEAFEGEPIAAAMFAAGVSAAIGAARYGVPIITSHTIVEAHGSPCVESAVIAKVDEDGMIVNGSEIEVSCDLICLRDAIQKRLRSLRIGTFGEKRAREKEEILKNYDRIVK